MNLPASAPFITLWSYDIAIGIISSSSAKTNLLYVFDIEIIATSGGFIMGVKPIPPNLPNLRL